MGQPSCVAVFILAVSFWGQVAAMDPCPATSSATGPAPDHSVFTSVLKDFVIVNATAHGITSNLVDYRSLRAERRNLKKYMLSLCSVNVAALSPLAQLALWANAYNALMFSIILNYQPSTSVKEIHGRVDSGSVWKEILGTVGGEKVSLDIIEHNRIRGSELAHNLGLAGRVHSAMVCASLSCPDIQTEAFEASTVEAQLTAATRRWIRNPTKNPGPFQGGGSITLSKIFDWYGGDFVKEKGSIQAFVQTYGGFTKAQVPDNAVVGFTPYAWGLNGMNRTAYAGARAVTPGILGPILIVPAIALASFRQ